MFGSDENSEFKQQCLRYLKADRDIPGFEERPEKPHPSSGPSLPTGSAPVDQTSCPTCGPLKETLSLAMERLKLAQNRVDAQIRDYEEAAAASSLRIGAYDVLNEVHEKYGVPFQDSERLPKEFHTRFPKHPAPDGILRAVARNLRARMKQEQEAEIEPRPKRFIHEPRYVHAPPPKNPVTPPPDSGSEGTSIPDNFSPGGSSDEAGSGAYVDSDDEDILEADDSNEEKDEDVAGLT